MQPKGLHAASQRTARAVLLRFAAPAGATPPVRDSSQCTQTGAARVRGSSRNHSPSWSHSPGSRRRQSYALSTTSPATPTGAPPSRAARGGAVETAGFEERPPNDGPGPAPGTRVPARNQGKSGPKPRSGTPTTRTDGSGPSTGIWGDFPATQDPGSRHRPGLPQTEVAQGRPEPAPGANPPGPDGNP